MQNSVRHKEGITVYEEFSAPDPLCIRLSGRGGQGIILGGVIIAQAAMYDGLFVVHTQSYGPEARLGSSKSEVVVSRFEIAFPEVIHADVFLCLSSEAYLKYHKAISPRAVSVIDDLIVAEDGFPSEIFLPLRRTARNLDNEMTANIVGIGALTGLAHIAQPVSVEKAIREWVKPEFRDVNLRALEAGLNLVPHSAMTSG